MVRPTYETLVVIRGRWRPVPAGGCHSARCACAAAATATATATTVRVLRSASNTTRRNFKARRLRYSGTLDTLAVRQAPHDSQNCPPHASAAASTPLPPSLHKARPRHSVCRIRHNYRIEPTAHNSTSHNNGYPPWPTRSQTQQCRRRRHHRRPGQTRPTILTKECVVVSILQYMTPSGWFFFLFLSFIFVSSDELT